MPCGWAWATRVSSERTAARMVGLGLWMRAMICGVTESHVSMGVMVRPLAMALSTRMSPPCWNQRVSSRRMSCSLRCSPRAMERKKASMAGTACACAMLEPGVDERVRSRGGPSGSVLPSPSFSVCSTSKCSIASRCHALYELGSSWVALAHRSSAWSTADFSCGLDIESNEPRAAPTSSCSSHSPHRSHPLARIDSSAAERPSAAVRLAPLRLSISDRSSSASGRDAASSPSHRWHAYAYCTCSGTWASCASQRDDADSLLPRGSAEGGDMSRGSGTPHA
mmetsp:Transcript_35555/g.93374  ORF Transcript_35555/g.93374 Transcript_35555/m.93374 type:complete len:281 (+) Transcript_35555:689-1531(+)